MSDKNRAWDVEETPALPSQTDRLYYHGFNKRQRAAIDLRVPDSGTPWLDEMIRQAVRNDVATEVLSGLLANCGGPVQANQMCGTNYCNGTKEMTVEWAVDLADALLARIGGAK